MKALGEVEQGWYGLPETPAAKYTEALCIPRTTPQQLLAKNSEDMLLQSVLSHLLVCSDDLIK